MNEWTIGKTKFNKPCRVFSNKKFIKLNKGYFISSDGSGELLSHAIWNHHHPEDIIGKEEVIHHMNSIRDDDRIENYKKLPIGIHLSDHQTGSSNSMFGKIGNFRQSECDWPQCKNKHRKNGMCDKHNTLIKYWKKKGITDIEKIMSIRSKPINDRVHRDQKGKFVSWTGEEWV
jgi:hypothetical protein